jgi:NitT/TauT family transport system permease protein
MARLAWSALSLVLFVLLWQVLAALLGARLLPGPAAVGAALLDLARDGALFRNIGVTLARVLASFAIAMLIGGAIGIALGRSRAADRLFDAWLVLFLNLPALVVIILCYVWFGLTEAAAVTAVAVNKIPNVAVMLREGARALDRDLAEMAAVYRFGAWKTFRHVVLPQLAPFFAAAARSGLALVWKIVLVVELLGRSNGVGFELQTAFQLFDVAAILAYALAFTAVVQAIELGLLQPWERAVNRWRR